MQTKKFTFALNDILVEEGLRLSQIKTKRELIETTLREFVARRGGLNLRDLRGTGGIRDDYDYKSTRAEGLVTG